MTIMTNLYSGCIDLGLFLTVKLVMVMIIATSLCLKDRMKNVNKCCQAQPQPQLKIYLAEVALNSISPPTRVRKNKNCLVS